MNRSTATLATFLLFVSTMPTTLSWANDGFGELGVGGIIVGKTHDVALQKEVLDISYNEITVHYDFINESSKDVTSLIVFPLPVYPSNPMEGGVVAHGQPSGFIVQVNDQPVDFKIKVHATIGKEDVTQKLTSIGFTYKQIAGFPFDKTLLDDHRIQVPKNQWKALQKAKLMSTDGGPLWQIHVDYEWMQTFPAKSSIHVMHRYHPFIAEGTASGYSAVTPDQLKEEHSHGDKNPVDFCLSDDQQHKLNVLFADARNLDDYSEIPGTYVEYVLKTANTWKDGVRDFQLRVHAGSDNEIVSSCYPEGLHLLSPGVYGVDIKHFKPRSDLNIYFGNIKPSNESNGGQAPFFD